MMRMLFVTNFKVEIKYYSTDSVETYVEFSVIAGLVKHPISNDYV